MRIALAIGVLLFGTACARADDEFENAPIEYTRSTPDNVVSRLQHRLQRHEIDLKFDGKFGYLPDLLRALHAPVESQMLVFSKTSIQQVRISPETPRAIYFSDNAYVGFCHDGPMLEVSTADPTLGAVFYKLDQTKTDTPKLVRQVENCLQCHHSSQSGDAPSHLVRSVFCDSAGRPIFSEGSFRVDHTTPLEERWGGWYVTGMHGGQKHLGNLIVREPLRRPIQNANGLNVTNLSGRFTLTNYLSPHSDIVALMVLEHQTLVQNLITRANFATRQALHYEAEINSALGEPPGHRLESTTHRIASAGDQLVKGLLFSGEARLTARIAGTSGFAAAFAGLGPRDQQGHSLRDFDLTKRLFKYPCSYLIYSAAFDGLPNEMKDYVAARLREILVRSNVRKDEESDRDQMKDFAHLSPDDRRAIWGILCETKPDLVGRSPK